MIPHDLPALPLRLARSCCVMSGAKRASQSRTASWVNSKPRDKNISDKCRRESLYRSLHRTTRRTMSVGNYGVGALTLLDVGHILLMWPVISVAGGALGKLVLGEA